MKICCPNCHHKENQDPKRLERPLEALLTGHLVPSPVIDLAFPLALAVQINRAKKANLDKSGLKPGPT